MSVEILPIDGIGEVHPGDDLARIIVVAAGPDGLREHDCVVVTQKVVSKAENRLAAVDPGDPTSHKPIVHDESVRVLRRRGDLLICETMSSAAEALGARQRARIVRAAEAFMAAYPASAGMRVRFDVILVRPWGPPVHMQDAWRPDDRT